MKAAVSTAYGAPHVLQIRKVEKPIPKDNEVLIRIHASTVTAGDCEVRAFKFPLLIWLPLRLFMGISKPRIKIYGQELAGTIEAVGKEVTAFQPGDEVFAPTRITLGAHAEYITLPESYALARKPQNVSFEEAASVPVGGLNALHFLRLADLQPGEKILINGAAGTIGTFAVQLAKAYGAEVTAVDSTKKLEMLRSIGADHVIDYTQEDFTKGDVRYDVIFDVVGKSPFSRCQRVLTHDGRYLSANPKLSDIVRGLWNRMTSSQKVITGMASYPREDLLTLKELIEAGKIKAVIDRRYPLEQIVEAHSYVETGAKEGSVVITNGVPSRR
jgi:NADPH:quinone reductase-like Zn-dependent oxidoreductase